MLFFGFVMDRHAQRHFGGIQQTKIAVPDFGRAKIHSQEQNVGIGLAAIVPRLDEIVPELPAKVAVTGSRRAKVLFFWVKNQIALFASLSSWAVIGTAVDESPSNCSMMKGESAIAVQNFFWRSSAFPISSHFSRIPRLTAAISGGWNMAMSAIPRNAQSWRRSVRWSAPIRSKFR